MAACNSLNNNCGNSIVWQIAYKTQTWTLSTDNRTRWIWHGLELGRIYMTHCNSNNGKQVSFYGQRQSDGIIEYEFLFDCNSMFPRVHSMNAMHANAYSMYQCTHSVDIQRQSMRDFSSICSCNRGLIATHYIYSINRNQLGKYRISLGQLCISLFGMLTISIDRSKPLCTMWLALCSLHTIFT